MSYTTNLSIAAVAVALRARHGGADAHHRARGRSRKTKASSQPRRRRRRLATTRGAAQLEFLVAALRTSLAEARLGELATQQSYDERVRNYGTKLKSDHTALASGNRTDARAARRRNPDGTVR